MSEDAGTAHLLEWEPIARNIPVIYCSAGGVWHATSPEIEGCMGSGATLAECKQAVRERLEQWLNPAHSVSEHVCGEGT